MSPPWMPLYIADYKADTGHLSAAEHGAYLLLIMHYWTTGALPNDDRQLARIACMTATEWRRSRDTIAAFFEDGWRHTRIDAELTKTAETASRYATRASKAGRKRWAKHQSSDATSTAASIAQAPLEECLSMPISQPHTLEPNGSNGADAPSSPPPDPDAELFRRGREVLGPKAGGMISKLKAAKGGSIPLARAAIEAAATKHDPAEYIGAICRGPPARAAPATHREQHRQEWIDGLNKLTEFADRASKSGEGDGGPDGFLPALPGD